MLPLRMGGLSEIKVLHEIRRAGARFPLMRGDGYRYGWYVVNRLRESRPHLMHGFVMHYSIGMEQADLTPAACHHLNRDLLFSSAASVSMSTQPCRAT